MNITEKFDSIFEDDVEMRQSILNIDNELMNLWIKTYYDKYWKVKLNLSPQFLEGILNDCKERDEYFVWIDDRPYIKKDLQLTNEECTVLFFIIENYSGLDDFNIWILTDVKDKNLYIKTIKETGKFPDDIE